MRNVWPAAASMKEISNRIRACVRVCELASQAPTGALYDKLGLSYLLDNLKQLLHVLHILSRKQGIKHLACPQRRDKDRRWE